MVYKLYNLVTPKSFKARLVQVTLEDDKNKKPVTPFYGILLEEEKQMAKRNKLVSVVRKIKPEQTQPDAFLNMAVFEYLIGNTDLSVQYLQNIKLLAKDFSAVPVTVPYDFDHAGIVSTPYAQPAEELQMSSVRQRRYGWRGCRCRQSSATGSAWSLRVQPEPTPRREPRLRPRQWARTPWCPWASPPT